MIQTIVFTSRRHRLTVGLENIALPVGDVVDPAVFNLVGSAEETLPPGHRVGADNGTRSFC